ncbi:tyrosine-type recombinase/integrase [Sphingobium cupriresistens]|uniref:Integrase n=1 Tax=Sphingobium cupriresistens TaxID=1132417 RepID=A0A8G2E0C7_9SPHN|nr:tyrosine-type recombinase/integrase [Sphingobium cupriresistens]RYM12532.1 integrase [Sphingobium cupriresistens]
MSRETSPYRVGDHWLDKRRDGRSPDIWQIAEYDPKTRSTRYISTKQRDLETAKSTIHAYVEKLRSKKSQSMEDAKIVPQLILYNEEHGKLVENPGNIDRSLRLFIGFLMQDDIGVNATVSDIKPVVINRFITWRMRPHGYKLAWGGRDHEFISDGVKGASVQRNINDIRAAIIHAANNGRIPYVPRIPSVPKKFESPPSDLTYTIDQMGAILAYATDNPPMYRWLALMMATAMRPDAALAFDPSLQWQEKIGLLDLHPRDWPRTDKQNPVVQAIAPFVPILRQWRAAPHPIVQSRKKAWGNLRKALCLPSKAIPKTIRHSIATQLRRRGVAMQLISEQLGHSSLNRTTAIYARYDPEFLGDLPATLTTIFQEILAAANQWSADHLLTTGPTGQRIIQRKMEMEYVTTT